MREEWTSARRLVVKVGSSLLVGHDGKTLKREWLASLAEDIKGLRDEGRDVILVSSGAIALGRHLLGLPEGALRLEESQAAAAVGQIHLAHAYEEMFRDLGLTTAQILLTLRDTEERRRYLNARSTLSTLLKLGSVPVVNENDTVATNEIRYGDNDRLAARVATMTSADCLVLLSDVDGFYTAPPGKGISSERLAVVDEITPEIEAMAGDAGTDLSRGGMLTKIEAAKLAVSSGTHMVIASGKIIHPLARLSKGGACTWFLARGTPGKARKKWIAGALETRGSVIIDRGAVAALEDGNSLLPAGVLAVEGDFQRGDCIVIKTDQDEELGRGLSAYDSQEAKYIAGYKSGEISRILGYRGRTALIHRDDMALR